MTKGKSERLPIERRLEVLRLVRREGAATVSGVAESTGASTSTVRRDLKSLEEQGVVQLSHGGAAAVEGTTFEPLFEDRKRQNSESKGRIAAEARGLIETGQSVIFDSSSTVLAVAEALAQRPVNISAVTNDVGTAARLSEIGGVSVVVPGGQVRVGSFTLLGSRTREFFDQLHADLLFLGIHAISRGLLTDASLEVVEVKRAMIRGARRVVLLADHAKFGPPAFLEVGDTSVVDDLITDAPVSCEALEPVRGSGETRIQVV